MNTEEKLKVIELENLCLKLIPDQINSLIALLVTDLTRWIKNLDKKNKELKEEIKSLNRAMQPREISLEEKKKNIRQFFGD